MKIINFFQTLTLSLAFCLVVISCNEPKEEKKAETTKVEAAVTDLTNLKAEVQALETAWAAAANAQDTATLLALYADDAKSLVNNKPTVEGKEALLAEIKEGFKNRVNGSTVAYDVMDVYGDENTVTEVGTSTTKDAKGKVTYTGKYMAVWQKRDGKYLCVREIFNDDVKAK